MGNCAGQKKQRRDTHTLESQEREPNVGQPTLSKREPEEASIQQPLQPAQQLPEVKEEVHEVSQKEVIVVPPTEVKHENETREIQYPNDEELEDIAEASIVEPNRTYNFVVEGYQVLQELNLNDYPQKPLTLKKARLHIDCDQANQENYNITHMERVA